MKQIYLSIILMLVIFSANAQISITTDNIFQQGDATIYRKLFDVDASFDVGAAGENIVWDFSNQTEDGNNENYSYIPHAGLPYVDGIPETEFAEELSGTAGYFYFDTDAGTKWKRAGWYASDSGTDMWLNYENMDTDTEPLELMHFPFTYGEDFSTNFKGSGEAYLSGSPYPMIAKNALYHSECDGWGMLKLGHKVYPNALRVHVTETFVLELDLSGTPYEMGTITDDAYFWYVEGVKGPVMSFVHSQTDDNHSYNAKWYRPDYTGVAGADFMVNSQTGNTDDIFTFTNLSEPLNQGSTFEWSFSPSTVTYMDGTDATSIHPKVKFDVAGDYTATIVITNSSLTPNTATETKTDYISIVDAPALVVDFSADIQNVPSTGTIVFDNQTVPDATGGTTYNWNLSPSAGWHFDNFTDATTEDASITFETDGCYAVQLTATNNNFTNSPVIETKMQFFNVGNVADCNTNTAVEFIQKSELSIYPNPANNILNINSTENVQISIVSITGQEIYKSTNSNSHLRIDISSYPKGLYLVNIISNKTVTTKKVTFK